jgi:hypothetical protein
MKKNHMDDYKFVCEYCDESVGQKRFVQKSAYQQHVAACHADKVSSTENPYAGLQFDCHHPDCDHSAKTKANMMVHFARTHCKDWIPVYAKNSGCKGCSKTFASSTAYYYHALGCIKPIPEEFEEMLADKK